MFTVTDARKAPANDGRCAKVQVTLWVPSELKVAEAVQVPAGDNVIADEPDAGEPFTWNDTLFALPKIVDAVCVIVGRMLNKVTAVEL